jgi:hypothetical protein
MIEPDTMAHWNALLDVATPGMSSYNAAVLFISLLSSKFTDDIA